MSQPTDAKTAAAARLAEMVKRKRAAGPAHLALNGKQGESEQAAAQWLRRIPDDPGGLWRRKFLYQYKREYQSQQGETKPW